MDTPYKPVAGVGSLHTNKNREGSQPNMRGSLAAPFDCKKGDIMEISAWTKPDKNGNKYLSLKAQAEYVPNGEVKKVSANFDDMDDDVPF